jgi:hypothetical protein
MKHSDHGIARDNQGQEQPTDKDRAQTTHQTNPHKSATREETRDRTSQDKRK